MYMRERDLQQENNPQLVKETLSVISFTISGLNEAFNKI